uniref:Uncharacterized protein n=1 Tax=Amphimedon queenslandica TaxID=400682 RepID=A0A1X7V6L9_AMPQE
AHVDDDYRGLFTGPNPNVACFWRRLQLLLSLTADRGRG